MSILAGLFIASVVVPTTIWIALATHYHTRQRWLRFVVSSVPIVIVAAAFLSLPAFPWAIVVWFGMLVAAVAWWSTLRPQADRDWAEGMHVLPHADIQDNNLRIRNFRNSSYTDSGEAIPHYGERSFDLSQLSSIDFFLSHWSGPTMAHTLVSFGFGDEHFLCVSVEARRRRWQKYSPLWGLFRCYELMFVLGDERDIIRLRTNVRREKVYMYRVNLPAQNLRRLLLDYVARLERLTTQPEWYNSITSNCTTNLFYNRHANAPWWLMPQIMLNGLSANAMYRLGYLDNQLPFDELQTRCMITERAIAAGDAPDFSKKIRETGNVFAASADRAFSVTQLSNSTT